MVKKILLIAPEVIGVPSFPSAAMGYIGTYLSKKGYEVRIVDSNFTKEDAYEALNQAGSGNLVGLSCDSKSVVDGLRIAEYAKAKGNIVAIGGLHVSLVKERILENSFVDYGVQGDGELSLLKLIQALEGKTSLAEVPGLIYRKDNQEIVNDQDQVENLDELPFPDYRLAGITQIAHYPLFTSRDCPYECSYCTVGAISHGRWRARSPENIIAELKLAVEQYKIRMFTVLEENFSHDIERVKSFCNLLIEEDLIFPWRIAEGVRADKVDRELLKLLKKSGCQDIIYGIESADESVFKNISKGEELSTIESAIELAQDEGMRVGAFFVVGLPGSTFASEMKSIEFVKKHRLTSTFWMAIPFYNTGLYNWVKSSASLLQEPEGKKLINSLNTEPFFETKSFPRNQVRKAFVRAQLRTKSYEVLEDFEGREISQFRRFLRIFKLTFVYDPGSFLIPVYVLIGKIRHKIRNRRLLEVSI